MTDIVADTDLKAWLPRRQLNIEDAITNTVTTLLTLDHSSTGVVATNFGLRLLARLEDASGNAVENAGALDFIWADPTGASEDCDLVISLKTAGAALAERHRFSSTGVYTPTGGVNLNNTDLTGVKDVYGSASANHNVYANAAVTDATERSLILNVLNATGDAWLAMITLTPAGAAPTLDFNSRPISNLTLGGAMNANSQNLGTIGTVTLGGTVTGGNQTLNALGHIGFGNTASDTKIGLRTSETYANPDNYRYGCSYDITATEVLAANANKIVGSQSISRIGAANDKNWTATIGLIALEIETSIITGATGVITGAAGITISRSISAATWTNSYGIYIYEATGVGTLTNQYGIYIENLTKGATLDYAIYSVGGLVYFGGNVNTQGVFTVAGTQVVGARVVDARCDDVINSGDAVTDGVIDALRDAMIAHGLIAAA